MDLSVDVETGSALSQPPSNRSSASHQGVEARVAVSSPPMEAPILQLSSSEELDIVSIDAESEDSPPQSHAFEELLDVITRAVERLFIEWPEDRQGARSKSKLDERFLPSRAQPQRRSLPFFSDLHTEVSRSATKETAKSIGRSMAALVATERHLWLDLSDIKDKEKYVLLDTPVSTQGLFGDAVNSAVAKSQEASKQAAALQKLLPRRSSLRLLSGSSLTHLKRALSTVPFRNRAFPPVLPHKNLGDTEGALKPSSLRGVKRICGPLLPPRRLLGKSPDVRGLRTNEGSPPRSRAVNTSFHGAILSSVPSGDRSANPATSGVTGRSGLRRAHISRSTRKRSGLGMPAPSEEGARAVCSVVPCRCAVTGRRTDYSTAGEKYGAVSLRCPQGTVLPTLPPPVLQGAAVSGEHISQGPPGNVVASGCPPPLRRVLEQSVRSFSAGAPLQGDEPTTQQQHNPETSLERLKRPTRFMGVLPTVVGPEQVLVMEQEVNTLLEKGAIEYVPPSDRETGFYSRYFIVPKKDGGLRPILDLRVLNELFIQLKFKMLTLRQIVSQIRSEDWFVTIDLKDAYFHISIRPCHWKFLRFAFGGKAYQYRVLPFGLALSPRTFTKCVDAALAPRRLQGIRIMNYIDDWLILAQSHQLAVQHRDVVLAHMKELGLRLNAKKSVLSPLQRTTFLGVVWDSVSMQALLSPPRVDSILAAVKSVKLGQLLTVKQFQRLSGLMAAASNGIPFGLLHMRPLPWWLRTRGFSPRGNPFRTIKVTRRCLHALVMWKKPWFLSQGPVLGAPCCRKLLTTDASLTGWGAILEGRSSQGLKVSHAVVVTAGRKQILSNESTGFSRGTHTSLQSTS
ncbi:unnamed protein product [Leuciscus chuanchicus]